jgi:ATP-dependent exoDNAse (exonuclease V) beta subunit
VYILNRELMPSHWAKKPWEKEQEENLEYVAYTRAKQKLSFIADYDGTN